MAKMDKHIEVTDTAIAKLGKDIQREKQAAIQLVQVLLTKRIDKVTAWDIESWRSKRHKGGLSAATSNRYIGTLKAMFNRAVEWEVIEKNPLTKVEKQKSDSRALIQYLSPNEEERLRAALRSRDRRLVPPFYACCRFTHLEALLGGFLITFIRCSCYS